MEHHFEEFLQQETAVRNRGGPPIDSVQVRVSNNRGGPEEAEDHDDNQTMVSEVTTPPMTLTIDPLRSGRPLYQTPADIPEEPDDVSALFCCSSNTDRNNNRGDEKSTGDSKDRMQKENEKAGDSLPTFREESYESQQQQKHDDKKSIEEPMIFSISKVPTEMENNNKPGVSFVENNKASENEKSENKNMDMDKELKEAAKMDMLNAPVPNSQQQQELQQNPTKKESTTPTRPQQQEDSEDQPPIPPSRPPQRPPATNRSNTANDDEGRRPGAYAQAPGISTLERNASFAPSYLTDASTTAESNHHPGNTAASAGQQQQQHHHHHHHDRSDTEMGGSENLSVANMVFDDGINQNLPHAQEYDGNGNRKVGEETTRKYIKLGLLLLGGIVLVASTVILVTFLNNNDDDDVVASISNNNNPNVPTLSPSKAPSMTLEGRIMSLLEEDTLLAMETDPMSPQSKAYEWLLEDMDNLPSYSDSRIQQKLALATLYFSTSGETWVDNTNWLDHDVHECGWITAPEFAQKSIMGSIYPGWLSEFFPPTEPPPYTCNRDGLYQHLWLDANNLVGSLPEELFQLSKMQTLSLGFNQLDGSLSSRIGSLVDLEGLSIFGQPPKGGIPSQIGILTKLRGIVLTGSQFEAPLPTELWNLTNLQTLILMDQPNMPGTIASDIGLFSNLKWLVSTNSAIGGTIPTELGQIESLEWLILFENGVLSGAIPTELATFPTKKQFISLGGNKLTGTLPTELGLLDNVFLLTLSLNRIEGTIPSQIGLLTNLQVGLALENNRLTGLIPTDLGRLTNLERLWLENNELSGRIPSELGELTGLGRLFLTNNSLSGPIPEELSSIQQSLHTLDLSGNPLLSGIVPEGICTVNGTFSRNPFVLDTSVEITTPLGVFYDCTERLCGCNCSCSPIN